MTGVRIYTERAKMHSECSTINPKIVSLSLSMELSIPKIQFKIF